MAKILNRKVQFEGVVYKSEKLRIQLDDGSIIDRDSITKNECSVGLVYHKGKDKFILVQEFRVGSMSNEIGGVAGIIERNEHPEQGIAREAIEETGYTPTKIESLGFSYTSSGFTDEKIHYFYIEVDGEPNVQQLDSDEQIEVLEYSRNDLFLMIASNQITGNHLQVCVLKCIMQGFLKFK